MPFPPPGDLPNPGIEPRSPRLWADSLLSEPDYNIPTVCVYPHVYTHTRQKKSDKLALKTIYDGDVMNAFYPGLEIVLHFPNYIARFRCNNHVIKI